MDLLQVSGIHLKDERGFELKNISLSQRPSQKIAIAGETGSGKTTLLKIIGGLIESDAGEVLFEGKKIIGPQDQLIPGHPGIKFLSQHFELPNNLRVEQVLEYANEGTEEDALHLFEVCHITHLLKRRTNQLSGGEKQRIAIARLLLSTPRLLLLDEPFSNTDMAHKHLLKSTIRNISEQLNISLMMISHDPLDTLPWADEILVMQHGAIVQRGTPEEIYRKPTNEYVAGLFGKYNFITGAAALALNKNEPCEHLLVRPESLEISAEKTGVPGLVHEVYYYGAYWELNILVFNQLLNIRSMHLHWKKGDTVFVSLKKQDYSG